MEQQCSHKGFERADTAGVWGGVRCTGIPLAIDCSDGEAYQTSQQAI